VAVRISRARRRESMVDMRVVTFRAPDAGQNRRLGTSEPTKAPTWTVLGNVEELTKASNVAGSDGITQSAGGG